VGSGVGLTTTNKGGSGCSCAVDDKSSCLLAGDELSVMITGTIAGVSVAKCFNKPGPNEGLPSSASGVGNDCGGPTSSFADAMVFRMLAIKWDSGLDKGNETAGNTRILP
jgi:hypothetical protein